MKKYLRGSSPVLILFIFWRLGLALVEIFVSPLWPLRQGFLGPVSWANMDGVHYLSIVRNGYFQFEQAFFPLYPLLIKYLTSLTRIPSYIIALGISHTAFLAALVLLYNYLKEQNSKYPLWIILLLLLFPTSFFFASVYGESLFLLFAVAAMYAAHKRLWIIAGIAGMLASATRLFGVFLFPVILLHYISEKKPKRLTDIAGISLIPFGLIAYMSYLWMNIGDPLAFFHAQPAFGAGRSGSALIFLPQVIWRYLKIFATVPFTDLVYQVAVFEILALVGGLLLCWQGWKEKNNRLYLLYSAAVLILPTLTGTLSSLPRYFLSAFPLFFVLGSMHNMRVKTVIAVIFGVLQVYFASAFLRGYFVA